jgi:DNA-binding response OmpR family regulator
MELGADDYITKPCTPQELLKAIAIRLEKQKTISRQSQKTLDELRTNISMSLPHELRTPLNAIMGFSELICQNIRS